ncbi:MAG: glycosyltransferase family 1 protein, partial [Phycisphaerales bacterium]|nr:glycosyltransferase family 1 protein [Phycisphaerales bacterium]
MLAMAAGCASISDDRLIVRRDFIGEQNCVGLYDSARPATARGCVDKVLANPDAAIEMSKRGRRIVEERHLWEHRLETILAHPGVVSVAR